MSEQQFSVRVPNDRHLRLVTCAGREPTAGTSDPQMSDPQPPDSLPSPGRATRHTDGAKVASRPADTIAGQDIVDLAYLSAIVLPSLKAAVAELEQGTADRDVHLTIAACRRFLAAGMICKIRADSLASRLA